MGAISNVFILIYVVNQNLFVGSAQPVTIPFQSISVASKTPSSTPCTTFTPASLPPVQTQGPQNNAQNYQNIAQASPRSGPTCQNGQSTVAQNFGQNLQQTLSQPCNQPGTNKVQYYQSASQPSSLSLSASQNSNPTAPNQNFVFTSNQNQNCGSNNLVSSPVSSVGCSTSSQPTGLNIASGPSSSQTSTSLNLVAAGPPSVNLVSSGLNVVSSPNSGLNFGPLSLVALNSNCALSQSSSNSLYPGSTASENTGCSGKPNIESISVSNGYNNAIVSPSTPVSNSGIAPPLSFNIQPTSQSCSCNNQPGSDSSSQNSLNVVPSCQSSSQPKFKLTNLRPLNNNVNVKSITFQPNSNSPLQIPSTLPSATPCTSTQSNQQSVNIGVSSSLQQDFTNFSPSTYNLNTPVCAQNPPQVSISPTVSFQSLGNSYSQQFNSPSNILPPQDINIIPQQCTNSGPSCNAPVGNAVNFGQFAIQNPVSSSVSPASSFIALSPAQIQNSNSGAACCNSQAVPSQNVQNALSGSSLNLVLDQQMLSQLLSNVASNVPSSQSSSCYPQVNAPQLNNYVQSSLDCTPITYNNNAYEYNNAGSYVSNCGSSQNLGSLLQNPIDYQVSNNIYNLYNQQSLNPYSTFGSQVSVPCPEYSNSLSSLPTVYTSNLASPSNSYVPSLTPTNILSAYYSKSPVSSINFDSIVSALSSPTITTEEITSLVSSLAESVLQQCNSLSSYSSAYPQSNINALPISVTTSPVESSYLVPANLNQYIPQQQSVSYSNTPSVEVVETSSALPCTQAGIKVKISEAPYSSSGAASYNSGQSLYSSNVQPYYSVQPSVYPPVIAGGERPSSSNVGIKDFVKILVLSELFNGGYGGGALGCGGNGLDGSLLALLLATGA